MRTLPLLLTISFAACGPSASDDERLPPVLHRLLLNENDDEGTPVTYGHLFHLDAEAMGREMKCVDCHHHLAKDPDGIPLDCATCHGPEDDELEDARKKGKVPGL
ncbi:MAG: cytochrome c3 family protein [Planctomycetota bacterium]